MTTNRGGRPLARSVDTGRQPMAFRVTPELRRSLEEAADRAGRSVSQEAELRLERSFRDDEVLAELAKLRSLIARSSTRVA